MGNIDKIWKDRWQMVSDGQRRKTREHFSLRAQAPLVFSGGLMQTQTFVVIQSLSRVWLFATPWTAAPQTPPSFTVSWSLFKLLSIELAVLSNHLILCCSLLLLPSIFPSIRVFSKESGLRIRWPKYRSFSFSISPSNEYSGLLSFRIYWFALLVVQGTLKSLLQHDSLKASILWHSAFFMVQLTSVHDYWKNHSFDYMTFCQQSDVSAF